MIYLKKQKCAINGEGKFIAVQYCGNSPFELAVRFSPCNLECGPCFAAGYSWPSRNPTRNVAVKSGISINDLVSQFNAIPNPSRGYYNWLRILGGEPMISNENINYLFDFLTEISRINSLKFNNGIIIQTNGIFLADSGFETFKNRFNIFNSEFQNIKVVVEISIKGTNPLEFKTLTKCSETKYEYNINCYFKLLEIDNENLRPIPAAGFGINESILQGRPKSIYRFTVVNDDGKISYHSDNWDELFKKLYNDYSNRYINLDTRFFKMPMHGIADDPRHGFALWGIKNANSSLGKNFYDSQKGVRPEIEAQFENILENFMYMDLQDYYSKLIS